MSYLYITEKFASVRLKEGQLVIAQGDEVIQSIPIATVEGIVLLGNSNLSSACIAELLRRELPVSFMSYRGKLLGRLVPARNGNIDRQRSQFRLGDSDSFRVELSRLFLRAKITNQIVVAKRYNRHCKRCDVSEEIKKMGPLLEKLDFCTSLPELMGYEGMASRLYFGCLGSLVDERYSFQGRSKRPPSDPFNSALSLTYNLLFNEVYTAVLNRGLNSYAGFLHSDKQGHPALVSDLMEEWRAVMADTTVMSLFNSHVFSEDDFYQKDNDKAIYISRNALKKIFERYEARLNKEHRYIQAVDFAMSFRKAIEYQTMQLCKALEAGDASLYHPFVLR